MSNSLLPIYYYYELPWKFSFELPMFTQPYIIIRFSLDAWFLSFSSMSIALRSVFNNISKVEFRTEKYDQTEWEL